MKVSIMCCDNATYEYLRESTGDVKLGRGGSQLIKADKCLLSVNGSELIPDGQVQIQVLIKSYNELKLLL
jgi:hypothetical protein